jgi:hypothetical protein
MAHASVWRDIQAEFQKYAEQYDDLSAECDPLDPGQWTLSGASPRAQRLFMEIAAKAAAKQELLSAKGDAKPWQLWLGYVHELGWHRPETPKPTPDLSPSRPKRLSWPERRRRAEQGARVLVRVFQTSADCCRDLAEREESSTTVFDPPTRGEAGPTGDAPDGVSNNSMRPAQTALSNERTVTGDSAGQNPFPPDHPAHQVWEGLPAEAREALSRLSLECKVEALELDRAFQEKFAETASIDLLEKYCLERFDLMASQLLIGSISPDPTSVNLKYESYLDTLQQKGREFVRTVLNAMRSEVRDDIVSRISLKLSSRKLHWLREAINWRLDGFPPRSPLNANRIFEVTATETGSSLDDHIQRVADRLELRNTGDAAVDSVARMNPPVGAAGDANAPNSMNEPSESARRRQKTAADLNAVYRRYLGRNPLEAGQQEELLDDAREYAAMNLTAALEELKLRHIESQTEVEKAYENIRDRIVLETLNNYVPNHKYSSAFCLGAREFKSALWTEGFPSLENRARSVIEEITAFLVAAPPPSGIAAAEKENPNAMKEGPTAPAEQNIAAAARKRGPQRDYETALQVAELVARHPPDGNWRARVEEICEELDEAEVRRPKPWKAKGYPTWYDCFIGERGLVIKAIEHHLDLAKEHKETFS